MSKPYFAKYLPVPGEIGSGDMFQFPGMSIKECLGTDDGLVWYESAYPDVSESASCAPGDCQRMVMHLMGAVGIQAGDKVLDRYGYPDKRSPKEEKWWTVGVMDIGNPCNLKECYKVIGPISPAARWVKEGDEFDEEQLQRMYAAPVRLVSRGGERKDMIYFTSMPSEAQLKEAAEYWLEQQSCYHCSVYYGEEPTLLHHVQVRCPCCNTLK